LPTPTDTPVTPGPVLVTKSVNPPSGPNNTSVIYTITIENQTGGPIILQRIEDNMDGMGGFAGTGNCTGPDGALCPNTSGSPEGYWVWTGTWPLTNGASATMTIEGTFVQFLPPTPTPPPPPQQFCNPGVLVVYNTGTASIGIDPNACFTLN
jgi:hypothetical protein